MRQLRRGNYAAVWAQMDAFILSRPAPAPAHVAAARQLASEAHFRAALLLDSTLDKRLGHLDTALGLTPDVPKLHFHRALTLWQMGRPADALPELNIVAAREPARPGLAYLRALASAALGQPWSTTGLSPAEVNTVQLVEQFVRHARSRRGLTFKEPLLGKGLEMWQALIAMAEDPTAAPQAQLKIAAEQNPRKPISRILNYYRGVAALRAGDRGAARDAWMVARGAGLNSSVLESNLTALTRAEAVALAEAGRWQDVVNLLGRLPNVEIDRILAETGSLAYFYLGYEAAQAGKWQAAAQHWRKASDLSANRYLTQNLALAEEALGNWVNAAEAWREMVRRRPRKEDHPDYLTDLQVAALWRHAAECYEHAGLANQVEVCLRNAIKYAPDDTAPRLCLADLLLSQQRGDAAETQLKEILAMEPQNLDVLVRLARLYQESWRRDAASIWRQVLAINPSHPEARDALAAHYISLVDEDSGDGTVFFRILYPGKTLTEVLKLGLQELPDHPQLLAVLGLMYSRQQQFELARENLMRALQIAPQNVRVVEMVLHELLHAEGGDLVLELIPTVRQIPRLLPAFWFEQASQALDCNLGEEWADRFITEALMLGKQPWVDDTPAGLLVDAFTIANDHQANQLASSLEQRIREEVPTSGAVQYVEAYRLYHEKRDVNGAMRLLQNAIRNARRAGDQGILRRAESINLLLKAGPGLFDISSMLGDLFPEM